MKAFCQYSGVNITLPHLSTLASSVLTVHPAFHLERRHLHKLYQDWVEGLIDDPVDRRLLFLALLNSTGLIDWQVTAVPKDDLVVKEMQNLYYTANWVTSVTLPSLKLPRFAVTKGTRDMANIHSWLRVWEQIREDFEAGYKSQVEIDRQTNREELLEKLIKTETTDVSRFAGILAQWGFDAANVPDNIREYWRQIFCSKGIAIFSIRKADIDEMVEHFEEELAGHGSIYSYTLLKHIRGIQRQVVTGLGFNTGNNPDLVDIISRSDFSILSEDDVTVTERVNVQKLINAAPSKKPVESDYSGKVAYLRAKISWDMAQRAAVNRETAEDRLQAAVDKIDKRFSTDIPITDDDVDSDLDNLTGMIL